MQKKTKMYLIKVIKLEIIIMDLKKVRKTGNKINVC